MHRLILVYLATIAAAGSLLSQDNWQVVEGRDKAFRILGPGKPQYEQQTVRVTGKDVTVHTYLFVEPPYAFILGYGDYPAEYLAKKKPEDVFKLDRDRFLKNTGTKLVVEKSTAYQGNPALEFVAHSEDNKSVFQVRLVLAGQRLYVLAVSFPVDGDTKPVNRFLDSLELVGTKK